MKLQKRCAHGYVQRDQCEVCKIEKERDELRAALAKAEQERDALQLDLEDWRFTNKVDELQRSHDALQAKLTALEGQEPAAWMYFHNRAEPELSVCLDEPDCIISFKSDVTWKKPLFLAAGAAPAPQGWQLVRVEPTDQMIQCGVSAASCLQTKQSHLDFQRAYKAMLAASPKAPT